MKIIRIVIDFAKSKQAARKERLYRQAQADAYAMVTSYRTNTSPQRRS